MDTKTKRLLADLAASPLVAKLSQDAEAERLAKRRDAIEALAAVKARAPLVEKQATAVESEIAAARVNYQDAENALGVAAGRLWGAQRRLEELWDDHQRSEGAAMIAVRQASNPRRQEIFLQPLRTAIDEARAMRPMAESDRDGQFARRVTAHSANLPSILARAAFLERTLNAALEYFMEHDDTDGELFRIRELILAHAPSAERLVSIPLDRDGARRAQEQEIARAVEAAEKLAKNGFGVGARLRPKSRARASCRSSAPQESEGRTMTQKIFRRLVEGKSVETDAAGRFRACFATFKVARDDHQFLDGAFVKNWKGLGKDGTTDFKRSGSPLLRGHDMEHNSVGRVEGLTETSEGLFGDAVFAPTAAGRELAQLYAGGWQCSFSVSWAPAEWNYATGKGRAPGAIDFKRVELIEISAVPVPADVSAVVQRAQRGDLGAAARTLGVKLAISEVESHVAEIAIREASRLLNGGTCARSVADRSTFFAIAEDTFNGLRGK